MTDKYTHLALKWKSEFSIKLYPPATQTAVENTESKLGPLPKELKEFYAVSNGISLEWFAIFPLEEPTRIKNTWNSLVRNNERYNKAPPGFMAFASLGEGAMAYFKLDDESIWFDEPDGLAMTTLNLPGFIEACLRDAT